MTIFSPSIDILVDIIGIIAFSISGFLVGVKHQLDILGITILTFLTALGGGIIRDIIVHRSTYVFYNYYPVITVIFVILIAIMLKLQKHTRIETSTIFLVTDTIGLISFSTSGALLGVYSNFNFFGVIILSFITAVGGGIIRDIIVNVVPSVLKDDFYGSISILISISIIVLNYYNNIDIFSITLLFIIFFILRFIVIYNNIRLPIIN